MVMDKLGFRLDEGSSNSDQMQINQQDARKLAIQRSLHALVHSSHCTDLNCMLVTVPGCLQMKKIVAHAKQCKRKANKCCPICKQFIVLCYHHAKACQEIKCPVLFCLNIRHKLRDQQLKQKTQILKRFATMQNHGMPTAQNNAESSYAASQPSPVAHSSALPYPTQPGLDMGGPTQIAHERRPSLPNGQQDHLQTLIKTQNCPNSPEQQQQVLSMLKSNPQLMAALLKQRTAQKSVMQQQLVVQPPVSATTQNNAENSYVASLSSLVVQLPAFATTRNNAENSYAYAASLPSPVAQPPASATTEYNAENYYAYAASMPSQVAQPPAFTTVQQYNADNSYAASQSSPIAHSPAPPYPTQPGLDMRAPSQIVPEQGPSLPNEQQNDLQTLIQTLKYPNSPEQQQQVLSMLKSNPQLMAALLKQRTAQKSAMQQKQQQW